MRPIFTFVMFVILFMLPAAAMAQYTNIRVSDIAYDDPEEVTIAINPTDPQNIFAASNIDYIYRSDDGGLTWSTDRITSTVGVWGDPVVIFDAQGRLYHSHLSWPREMSGDWLDRIVIQRSDDQGVSFNDGSWIGLAPPKDQDKEWMAIDTTGSPWQDNLYIAWTEFDSYGSSVSTDSTRILFARSTDQATSWGASVRVSDLGGNCIDEDETVEGAVPAVGPGGEIYMAWSGHDQIWLDRSLDGGLSFGADQVIATQPGGWDFAVPGINRCNGMPVTLCDTTGSAMHGNLYVVWSDQREGVDDTDIWFIRSDDDPATGYLYIVFYDRRGTAGEYTDVFVAMSADGGDTWSDFQVSETSFLPESHVFFGDYTNIAALDGKVYPIWMRMDQGVLSVWTALVQIPLPTAAGPAPLPGRDRVILSQNWPNPFNPSTRIDFVIPDAASVMLRVYDLAGARVATLLDRAMQAGPYHVDWDGRDERGQRVSSGVYLYELQAGEHSVTRKMTLVK